MKRIKILFAFVLMAASLQMSAQRDNERDDKRREKIEVLKRTYISEKLELTVAEAEKFWPIYNEYDAKKDESRRSIRAAQRNMKEGEHSEKEAIETIDLITRTRKDEAEQDSKFLKDCLPVLGVAKVMKLATLEKEFQKQLMERVKERRKEGQNSQGSKPNH